MSDHHTYRLHPDDRRLLTAIQTEARDGRRALNAKLERMTMATKEQLDKLRVDVAALITEAVTDIKAAVDKAQNASPDPAIDQLDKDVTDATQALKDAAAKLNNPAP